MLFNKNFDRRKSVMIHLTTQTAGWTLDDNMLVHFIVSTVRVRVGQFFIPPQRVTKQAEVPVRIIRMPKPSAHEHEAPVYPISGGLTCARNRAGKFFLRPRRQHFVGVEDKDPFISKRKILQGPILFFPPLSVESEIHTQ